MKSTFLSKEKNEVKFTMEFTAEEFEKAINEVYQSTKGRYAVDGFRKGKAPRKLIEANYGEDIFLEDAINNMFSQAYPEALQSLDIYPVDSPSAEFDKIEKGKGFTTTITVTVRPEFEVKDYKGVKVKKIEHPVTEEDVDKDLESLQNRNSRLVTVERAAKDGDTVIIDYAGFVGDDQFEGGTAERQPLKLGSGSFIPGFEEQLIGTSAGEEKDVVVTFPEEYHSEALSGKEAVFKCKVHEVKETEVPELNDEFAKDVSEFDTLEELKQNIKEKLEKSAASKVEMETKNAILEKVYEANEIDIPQIMVDEQAGAMVQELAQQLSYQGMNLEMYCQYLQKTPEDLQEEFKEDALKRVKTRLLVEAVANAEGLEASEEEMEAELKAMAEHYKIDVDKLRKDMGFENFMLMGQDIKMRKAVDFMFENAIVE
ncbi:MAG: trigger factor [Anaerovoracaceae bacterium]|jgi:trigger factor